MKPTLLFLLSLMVLQALVTPETAAETKPIGIGYSKETDELIWVYPINRAEPPKSISPPSNTRQLLSTVVILVGTGVLILGFLGVRYTFRAGAEVDRRILEVDYSQNIYELISQCRNLNPLEFDLSQLVNEDDCKKGKKFIRFIAYDTKPSWSLEDIEELKQCKGFRYPNLREWLTYVKATHYRNSLTLGANQQKDGNIFYPVYSPFNHLRLTDKIGENNILGVQDM